MNELIFTNERDEVIDIIIEPVHYHLEIAKGETYLYKTKETQLVTEYGDGVITIYQGYELGFAVFKEVNKKMEIEIDLLDSGRIG